jgi:hypothetical protein
MVPSAGLFRNSSVKRPLEVQFGVFDTLARMPKCFLGPVSPCTLAVPIPDLFLVAQAAVELLFECAYVEAEFFMLPDLVV